MSPSTPLELDHALCSALDKVTRFLQNWLLQRWNTKWNTLPEADRRRSSFEDLVERIKDDPNFRIRVEAQLQMLDQPIERWDITLVGGYPPKYPNNPCKTNSIFTQWATLPTKSATVRFLSEDESADV